jgi:hypothetical protein
MQALQGAHVLPLLLALGLVLWTLLGWLALRAYMQSWTLEIKWPWELVFLLLCGPVAWAGLLVLMFTTRKDTEDEKRNTARDERDDD